MKWSKYWSFSFSIHLSNEYSGLISFTMDWLDLLAVQGTLKSLLQHHSSKGISSVQFSHSVVSASLRPHELQVARPPCPSPTSWSLLKLLFLELVMPSNHLILCYPLLLPSVFPSIRVSFMSQFFLSGDQIIGDSSSASVLPMNIQE